jgi:hypothetical protein
MVKTFQVGDLVSFKGSTSWGIIVSIDAYTRNTHNVWVKPICGTPRWMNPPLGGEWSVTMGDLMDIPEDSEYKELGQLLYGD